MTGGLSLEVHIYRNVVPCYRQTGLLSEVGLLSIVVVLHCMFYFIPFHMQLHKN